ncbi:hybrid sensor histidine kinase/response regulator [Lichenihabitans psoromatis]|uniref:hybrid sensor histidine kinase/response regulator n=1 Tax=Lichenihabitans psoromatis TaxID=2528642 RepID=UPI00103844D3|nr:PAS domain-containing hybrid sensor histidine kinase/response regulator [Lichenihabitans psoromatis]
MSQSSQEYLVEPVDLAALGLGGQVVSKWFGFADAVSDGVYGVDRGGLCIFVNPAAIALLGYETADELLGRNMHQTIHHTRPDGSPFPIEACPLIHTLTSGRSVRLDTELLWRKDGSSFVARYSSYPMTAEDGAILGSAIVFTDCTPDVVLDLEPARAIEQLWGSTERRRAEEALRSSEAKFRTLADSISQLAWMTDPEGAIVWYNRRWYDYTGTTPEKMQGWGWQDVHHPDHMERVVAHIAKAFSDGAEWEDTFPLRGKDGEYRWFLSRAMPIHDRPDESHPKGRILGWFGTNTDVTDMREAEDRLSAAKDAAEEANRTKSDFIANMSHELRTPLSAIIGYSEMMQEEIADGADPTELSPDLRKVEANARHLLGLINDVLDLSKIESGKMEVFSETFDTATTLQEVASTVQGLIDKKGNRLVLDLGHDLGVMQSDVTKLRQILLNLLSNAAKFTEGGTITLGATRIVGAGPAQWLSFRVSDTGIGMSAEQLEKLFLRFSQADASTTRKFGGTGLGLSISKAFSVMLGGDIAVESGLGQGSVFTVMVPAVWSPSPSELHDQDETAADATTTRPGGSADIEKDWVLVIDDDPAQRELMSRFLAREGFGARTAADGRTGIEMARAMKPRAILLDVMMPGMDGWSVLSVLKADPALEAIPVVMITFVSERGLALSLGASEYVLKPVQWDRFKQVMDRFREAGGTVLVVDDEADTRERMRVVLERDGWTVVEAANGQEALDRVAEGVPQVVVLDVNMPIMDGFAFLPKFREMAGCAETPVIVLTAADLTLADRKRLRGASQVLNKGDTTFGALAKQLRALAETDPSAEGLVA